MIYLPCIRPSIHPSIHHSAFHSSTHHHHHLHHHHYLQMTHVPASYSFAFGFFFSASSAWAYSSSRSALNRFATTGLLHFNLREGSMKSVDARAKIRIVVSRDKAVGGREGGYKTTWEQRNRSLRKMTHVGVKSSFSIVNGSTMR